MTGRRCTALTRDGNRCSQWATRDSDPATCWIHSQAPADRQRFLKRIAPLGGRPRGDRSLRKEIAQLKARVLELEGRDVYKPAARPQRRVSAPSTSQSIASQLRDDDGIQREHRTKLLRQRYGLST